MACALVSSGIPAGMLSFSLIITFLLEQFHWKIMFRILGYLGVIICLLSLIYGWIEEVPNISEKKRKSFCDMSLCKRPRFFVFMLGSSVSMLGWSVGNFFLVSTLAI
jgi:MFS family permease